MNELKKIWLPYLRLLSLIIERCTHKGVNSIPSNANVFGILGGGGSATFVNGLLPALDHQGWFYSKILVLGLEHN